MGDVKQYKYKIDLELGAKDFSPEIAKMFSKVQQQADKEKVVLTLTGDDKDIIKQLTDLKSKVPNLDLSKAITVGFSDALKADGDKAQKYAQNFLTNIVNSVSEALKSIDSIKDRIKATEKDLKTAEGKLDFLGAGDADKALVNLTKRFQGIKAEEKNVGKLRDTFQQIKDIAASTGKEIPEGVQKYMSNLKTAFGKDIFKDIKPSKSYEQYFEEASSDVFKLRNELFELKKELETSMNPEIQVKGKLSDNFIGDLQSQLDQMTGIEVKVKPKIDKDVKLEVEVEGDVKPTVQSDKKIELPKSAEKIDLGKYDLSKIEVVNEKLSEYKSEAESISESAQKAVDELNKFTGKSYTLNRNMHDIPSTLRAWNKASMSANDFKKEIKAAIEANEKEKAAILYENLKTFYPKTTATLDTFKDKDFKDNYDSYLSRGKTKVQTLQLNSDLQRYRVLEDVIHQLEIKQGGLVRETAKANTELEKQAKISSELSKYDTSTKNSRNSAIQSLDQQIAQKEAEMANMLKLDKDFQDDYHKLARARTNHESTEEYGQLLEKYNIPKGSGLLQSVKYLANQRGELQETIDILKGVRQVISESNEAISAPPNTSGMDKVEEELHEEAAAHRENEEAAKADAKAQEQFSAQKNIRKPHDEYIGNQIKFLQEYKKAYEEYDALEYKNTEEGLTSKEESRLDELREKIKEYDEILKQYSDVRVQLKNGDSYSIINDIDPSDWNTKKSAIKDIVFELKEEAAAADEAAKAERVANEARKEGYKYSSSNNPYKALKKGGLGLQYFNDDEWNPDEPQEYEDNVVRIIESNEKFAADADITCEKASTAVRKFFDTIGKQIPELATWKDMILEAVDSGTYKQFDTDSGLWGWGLEETDEGQWYMYVNQTKEAAEETVKLRYELAQLGSLKNKIFKDWGLSGTNFKNGIFPEDQEKYLAEEKRIIAEVKAGTLNYYDAKDQLSDILTKMSHNKYGVDRFIDDTRAIMVPAELSDFKEGLITQIKNGSLEAVDAVQLLKDKVSELQTSNQTPVLYEEPSGQMSMFEQEAEAKRNDAKATTELAEAEKAASDIPNQITIDEYTERLREEEEQARRTAEAEEKLAEIRNSVYKNQSGGVTSGNYSYDRYDDKNRTLAEKYHGVVYTDEDGNLQSNEKLMVDYDKLLSEILKYDTQIYKVNQDIANAEGNTDGLEKKKRLLDDQLAKYEELIKKVSTDPDYVANRNTAQLSYISEQRDLNRQLLEAETLISKAKSDEAAKQKAINIATKTQEDAYKKMWEYRTQINLADKNEDASKIANWKNRLQVYKDIYDKATQTVKQLDVQKAKEQELVSLAKIRREIVDKYNDNYAAKADKKRSDDITASIQKERAAYKEYWSLRKKYETLDPDNKKNTGDIARLKARAQEQREIYKAEMQNLQALDQDLAKEEALNNVINIRKQTIKEIKDINASKADKDVDTQINNGIAAQKKIGTLKGIRYQAEQNPYIDDNDNLFASIDAVISKYQKQIDVANNLISTTEQQKRMNDAVAESNLAYEKAVSKVTEATNKQNEAGKRQDQQLESTRSSLQKQAAALTANGKLMRTYGDQVRAYLEEIQNPTTTLERLNAIRVELNKISAEATVAGQSGKSFFQILKQRATSLVAYLGTFASFYRVVGYIKQAVSTIRELDTELIDLRKTTAMTTSDLNQFYLQANDIAIKMGVTTKEIITQAAAWSRLGYNTKEASAQMAELSSQFASISPGVNVENATDYLVSTMKAFDKDTDEVMRSIMDNINAIGNSMATTNGEIGEMLERSSAAMAAANNTIEETIALESAAVEITRNAETTGTAFRTNIIVHMYSNVHKQYI